MDQAGRISEPPNTLITSGTVAKQELCQHISYISYVIIARVVEKRTTDII